MMRVTVHAEELRPCVRYVCLVLASQSQQWFCNTKYVFPFAFSCAKHEEIDKRTESIESCNALIRPKRLLGEAMFRETVHLVPNSARRAGTASLIRMCEQVLLKGVEGSDVKKRCSRDNVQKDTSGFQPYRRTDPQDHRNHTCADLHWIPRFTITYDGLQAE
jgi:hypothetical protein